MYDIVNELSIALATKHFETASDAIDFVLKKCDETIDFQTFIILNELAQIQLNTGCNVKFFL